MESKKRPMWEKRNLRMMLPIGLRFSTETLNFRVSGSGSILDRRKKSPSSTKAFDEVARKEAQVFAADVVALKRRFVSDVLITRDASKPTERRASRRPKTLLRWNKPVPLGKEVRQERLVVSSVTKLGSFWKVSATNCLIKVAQIIANSLG